MAGVIGARAKREPRERSVHRVAPPAEYDGPFETDSKDEHGASYENAYNDQQANEPVGGDLWVWYTVRW